MMKTVASIERWMDDFAKAVRSQDYDAGRALFADDVFSFGTYSGQLVGLDALVENQWKPVWSVTRNFHFLSDTVRCAISGDCAWIAVAWQSQGQNAEGVWYDRQGRTTLILQWQSGEWKAMHSHFSLSPRPTQRLPK